jgi:prevent-host-death family protein
MIKIGAFDAKTHLPALLERVVKGETIQITRRGVPVAMLTSVQAETTRDAKEAAARIRQARKGIRLRGLRLKDLINEGRR